MRSLLSTAALLAAAALPAAAEREPHIGYVYPAGGRAGSTLEVVVGGQNLDGATGAWGLAGAADCEVVRHLKALTSQQLNGIRNSREKLKALEEAGQTDPAKKKEAERLRKQIEDRLRGAGLDPSDAKAIEAYRRRMSDPKRQLNPAISESVTLRVSIPEGAAPGCRDLRIVTSRGLSNPLPFHVTPWAERVEMEPNDRRPESVADSGLPLVLNGQILPGDVDRFQFAAHKGERLVVAAAARSLVPYLADAVPGWFQATLSVRDAKGTEVGYSDDFRFSPDPAMALDVPADGLYTVEIKDSIYRGREDFVYRLSVGSLPFVTAIFPLGGRIGSTAEVKAEGWNLPSDRLALDLTGGPGLRLVTSSAGQPFVNPVAYAVDDLPERDEREPDDEPARAMAVERPVIVNGRIERPGDRDVFSFRGRAGETLVAEVLARRLNSPLDGSLRLTDAKGRELAANDDREDKASGLATHHADPEIVFTLPADGAYLLHLADAQRKGGPAHAYRLRISAPRPGFDLRVAPSSVAAPAGRAVPLTVYAVRRDGFDGEIRLALTDAPAGFTLDGGRIPPGRDSIRATLSCPATPGPAPVVLRVEGRAEIDGAVVTKAAVPADDMMQAFAYRHLVPCRDFVVAVTGDKPAPPPVERAGEAPVRIPSGGEARVTIRASGRPLPHGLHLELAEPPKGLTLGSVQVTSDGIDFALKASEAEPAVGFADNVIVEAFLMKSEAPKDGKGGPAAQRRVSVGILPAIPFEVVRR